MRRLGGICLLFLHHHCLVESRERSIVGREGRKRKTKGGVIRELYDEGDERNEWEIDYVPGSSEDFRSDLWYLDSQMQITRKHKNPNSTPSTPSRPNSPIRCPPSLTQPHSKGKPHKIKKTKAPKNKASKEEQRELVELRKHKTTNHHDPHDVSCEPSIPPQRPSTTLTPVRSPKTPSPDNNLEPTPVPVNVTPTPRPSRCRPVGSDRPTRKKVKGKKGKQKYNDDVICEPTVKPIKEPTPTLIPSPSISRPTPSPNRNPRESGTPESPSSSIPSPVTLEPTPCPSANPACFDRPTRPVTDDILTPLYMDDDSFEVQDITERPLASSFPTPSKANSKTPEPTRCKENDYYCPRPTRPV